MIELKRRKADFLAITLIFVTALIVYAQVLAPGRTLLPTDLLLLTPPWAQLAPTLDPNFTHVLRRTWDPLFQFYPARLFLAQSLRHGWIPLWNPHIFSGTPFAADGQSAIFYPINWLFAVLPIGAAFGIVAFLHSFLTGTFFYCYSRRIGCSVPGSVAGAIIWMLCGVQVGWQMWQVVDSTLCWLPLCLYFWEGLRQSEDLREGLGLSFAIAMTLLAGHLQFAFYVLLVAVSYALYRPIRTNSIATVKSTMLLVVFSSLGVLLSLVQILATADLLRQSIRNGAPINQLLPSALPISQIGLLIMPEIFGGERDYLNHAFLAGDYYEKVIYVGAAALVFALFALRLKRAGDLSRYWLGIGVFALLMGCGSPLYRLFYYAVPLFKSFHGLSRAFVLFDFAIAALAAQGVTLFGREPVAERKLMVQISGGAALLICLIAYRLATLGNGSEIAFFLTHPWLQYGLVQLGTAVFFVAAAILILVKAPPKFSWVAVPLVAVDMLLFAIGLNPGGSAAILYPSTPETQAVTSQLVSNPTGRILCLSDTTNKRTQSRLIPNSAMSLGWNDISGSDPLILTRYDDFIRLINCAQSGQPEPAGQGMIADSGNPALDFLNVKWIFSPTNLEPTNYRLGYSGAVNIYDNPNAKGGAWLEDRWKANPTPGNDDAQQLLLGSNPKIEVDPGNSVPLQSIDIPVHGLSEPSPTFSVIGPGKETIELQANRPSILVISQTACPGWKAVVDSVPNSLTVVDSMLAGLYIAKPGNHLVELTYAPDAVRIGLYGVFVGWLWFSIIFAWATYQPSSKKQVNSIA